MYLKMIVIRLLQKNKILIIRTVDKNKKYLYNSIVTKIEKISNRYKNISLAKGELEWHNQKEDGQKQEHI